MKFWNKLVVLVATLTASWCLDSVQATPPTDGGWVLGDPIVSYWCGPTETMPLNDRSAAQLKAGGWNLGWARTVEDLDTYHRHGLRAKLVIGTPDIDDPDQAKKLAETIQQVKHHPALYAYHLIDEPNAQTFPRLGKLVAFLRKHDHSHLAYINLFPTYASNEQLGTNGDVSTAYREYLRQFVAIVKPGLISYDHYHFMKESDSKQYFLNLAITRDVAVEAGLPFLNVIQSCDSPLEGWRGPNEHEIRWLTFTSLAYGAQGICHFRYDLGLCQDADSPNSLFWPVTRANQDYFAMAVELRALQSLGAYHCGTVPTGGLPLTPRSPFHPASNAEELLLGYFGNASDRPTHVVVVNLDYRHEITTTLSGPGPLQAFHAPTRVWSAEADAGTIKLRLPPGGGALVRTQR
ncbi:MAG: hypothetical protein O2931_03020 [Planctomycetota bacterium]|nr:hypothetical protein [Planctomycetota bacterium]MDA1177749.1 hypothetical protein [Planctomycetota bacterium]